MMLGFLLARAGIPVAIVEKHKDFLRDFRGDTIHPSTLELMYELGILDEFLRLPHQEALPQIGVQIDDFSATYSRTASHLPTHCKFVGLMPAVEFPEFHRGESEGLSAISPVYGVRSHRSDSGKWPRGRRAMLVTPQGDLEVRADLTVGADGRRSIVREKAGFEVIDPSGAPIDVLWMRLGRRPDDPDQTLGRVRGGRILVTLDRGDHWQCAYLIRKREDSEEVRKKGLPWLREDIVKVVSFSHGPCRRTEGLEAISACWSVAVDRLRHWSRPGLLCIGDSAHAMSPVGGVGINLAIRDGRGRRGEHTWRGRCCAVRWTDGQLGAGKFQKRRELPTRDDPGISRFSPHTRLLAPTLASRASPHSTAAAAPAVCCNGSPCCAGFRRVWSESEFGRSILACTESQRRR